MPDNRGPDNQGCTVANATLYVHIGRVDLTDPDSLAAIVGMNFNSTINPESEVAWLSLPGSGTDHVENLTDASNVGTPGVWIYRIDTLQAIRKAFYYKNTGGPSNVRCLQYTPLLYRSKSMLVESM